MRTVRFMPLSTDRVLEALAVAWDREAPESALTMLPLNHIDVWHAVSSRRRVPRRVREQLFAAASGWPLGRDGQWQGESSADFELRVACVTASARWLTERRLSSLVRAFGAAAGRAQHCDNPRLVAQLTETLARHPRMTLELMGSFLDELAPGRIRIARDGWSVALPALRELGHPWSTLAAVAEQLVGGDASHLEVSLATVGKAMGSIDEISGRVLVGMLPGWRGKFAAAVASARDVTDNPDPAELAVEFGDYLDSDSAPAAVAFAEDADTPREQLRLLPLNYLGIWSRVAARDDLDADLRTALIKQATDGPSRMLFDAGSTDRHERVTYWARRVLAPAWLSRHRLKKLATIAARNGADPEVLVDLLLAHPNVTGDAISTAIGEIWRGYPKDGAPSGTEVAIARLTTSGAAPWAALGPVMTQLRTIDNSEPYPLWRLELNRWNLAGRLLDALNLPADHLERTMRLLPTWPGGLESAVQAARTAAPERQTSA